MLLRPIALQGLLRPRPASHPRLHPHPRFLLTLAIETSCDDTSVAVLEKTTCTSTGRTIAKLHFHKKITSNNVAFNGVHPLVALESHQENLARLVAEAIDHLPSSKLGNALAKGCIDEDELGSRVHYEVNEEHTIFKKRLPDFISVTRGPGMRSNLFTGLDTAKGLAVAWQKPLVGVHHMQAHALTPRLVDALQTRGKTRMLPEASTASINAESYCYGRPGVQSIKPINAEPDFPFLSVLASGGHTLLVRSASLTDHEIMASTSDIAIGECLDKIARIVLPPEVLQSAGSTMYGALLETFAFPDLDAHDKEPEPAVGNDTEDKPGFLHRLFASTPPEPPTFVLENSTAAEYRSKYKAHYTYTVPKNHEEALKRNISMWGWGFNQPLSTAQGGLKSKSMEMSFSGLTTAVERVVRYESDPHIHKLTKIERRPDEISPQERRDLAHHAMRAAFEHLASRVISGLQHTSVTTVVMAGGVAANSYLRYILACTLCANGYDHVKIMIPPASLCCDNAAMIAWAGLEMFQDGTRDRLSIRALRKWPLDQLLCPPFEKTPRFPMPAKSPPTE